MPDFFVLPEITEARKEFYTRLDAKDTAPLWEALARLVTPEPQPACEPAAWSYREMRPLLMEAGELITAKEAERRVLVLENPGIRGISQITQSLYAGLQLVLPQEITSTHRHAATAIRLVLEGEGAYTAVEGERTTMHPGDFILTPSWTFHDHGNPGNDPVVWLYVLDVPIVNLFDTSFAEHYAGGTQPVTRAEGDTGARFASNMLPYGYENRPSHPRRILAHLYLSVRADARRPRTTSPAQRPRPAPRHQAAVRQTQPPAAFPSRPSGPSCSCCLPDSDGLRYRTTDATIYCALEGEGSTKVESATDSKSSTGRRVMYSSCPRGTLSHTPPAPNRFCSVSRTAPRSKAWASGGNRISMQTTKTTSMNPVRQARARGQA